MYYSINMKFDANPLIKSAIANPKGNTGKAKEKLTFIDEYLINECYHRQEISFFYSLIFLL